MGTEEQWKQINIGDGNALLTNANIHYDYEYIGDVNGDSYINSTDALIVLQHTVKKITLTKDQQKLADVNKDNLVNSNDALWILEYAVGKR